MRNERYENERTIGQHPDGTWYWLDETWNYGSDKHYTTREEAVKAQARYCAYELEGDEASIAKFHKDYP